MARRYWKIFPVIILIVLNTGLFILFLNRKEDLKWTFEELSQSPTLDYFEDNNLANALRQMRPWSTSKKNDIALGDASDELAKVIHTTQQKYVGDKIKSFVNNQQSYFLEKIALDASLQSALWEAFENYQSEATRLIEVDLARKIRFRDSLGRKMQEDLQAVESRFKKGSPGKSQEATLRAPMGYGLYYFTIRGVYENNSIRWEEDTPRSLGYDDYVNLMVILKGSTHSPRVLQAQKALNKMASSFSVNGKVEMYGKTYALTSVTGAEVDSICKYLLLLQWKSNNELLEAFHELSRFGAE